MQNSPILIVTGRSGSGKSQILKTIFEKNSESGLRIKGILAPGKYPGSGSKVYDMELLPGNMKFPLSGRESQPDWISIETFWFNPRAIEAGLEHLSDEGQNQNDLYILDEIGPFELKGHLWADIIPILLNTDVPMIWTMRNNLIKPLSNKFGLRNLSVLNLENGKSGRSLELIQKWIDEYAGDKSLSS